MTARRTFNGVWGFFFALPAAHAGQCVFRQASAGKRRAMRQAERPKRVFPPFLLSFLDKYPILPLVSFSQTCVNTGIDTPCIPTLTESRIYENG